MASKPGPIPNFKKSRENSGDVWARIARAVMTRNNNQRGSSKTPVPPHDAIRRRLSR